MSPLKNQVISLSHSCIFNIFLKPDTYVPTFYWFAWFTKQVSCFNRLIYHSDIIRTFSHHMKLGLRPWFPFWSFSDPEKKSVFGASERFACPLLTEYLKVIYIILECPCTLALVNHKTTLWILTISNDTCSLLFFCMVPCAYLFHKMPRSG